MLQTSMGVTNQRQIHDEKIKTILTTKQEIKRNGYNMLRNTCRRPLEKANNNRPTLSLFDFPKSPYTNGTLGMKKYLPTLPLSP
jgi:hypothetical protein